MLKTEFNRIEMIFLLAGVSLQDTTSNVVIVAKRATQCKKKLLRKVKMEMVNQMRLRARKRRQR